MTAAAAAASRSKPRRIAASCSLAVGLRRQGRSAGWGGEADAVEVGRGFGGKFIKAARRRRRRRRRLEEAAHSFVAAAGPGHRTADLEPPARPGEKQSKAKGAGKESGVRVNTMLLINYSPG
jgi:hypothetical protein